MYLPVLDFFLIIPYATSLNEKNERSVPTTAPKIRYFPWRQFSLFLSFGLGATEPADES